MFLLVLAHLGRPG